MHPRRVGPRKMTARHKQICYVQMVIKRLEIARDPLNNKTA